MALSTETIGRLWASGRNYASMFVGFVGGVGVISASQSKGLTDALSEIYNGVNMVVHGATSAWQILVVAFPIITIAIAKLASNSAKTPNQAAAVKATMLDPNSSQQQKEQAVAAVADTVQVAAVSPDIPVSRDAKVAILQAAEAVKAT